MTVTCRASLREIASCLLAEGERLEDFPGAQVQIDNPTIAVLCLREKDATAIHIHIDPRKERILPLLIPVSTAIAIMGRSHIGAAARMVRSMESVDMVI